MDSSILCASGIELSILVTTISIYIGEIFDVDDLITIANFSNMLGDSISLIASQKARCKSSIVEGTN